MLLDFACARALRVLSAADVVANCPGAVKPEESVLALSAAYAMRLRAQRAAHKAA